MRAEDFHGDNESHANARPDGVHHAHFKAFDVESEGMQGETQCREDDHRKRRRRIDSGSIASIATPMRKPYSRTAVYSEDIQGPPRAAAACAHSYIVRSSSSCPEVIDAPSKARTRSARV